MKYSIPLALILSCALTLVARAQETTAPVLADVTQALVLTSTGQTSFGKVPNTAHTETIDPTAPAGAQTTAEFGVSFAGLLGSVTLTCPSEVTLTEPGSSAVITFTPQLSGSNPFQPGQSGSTLLSPCPNIESPRGIGGASLWLGGSIGIGSGQAAGSYSGVFTLTAAYQ